MVKISTMLSCIRVVINSVQEQVHFSEPEWNGNAVSIVIKDPIAWGLFRSGKKYRVTIHADEEAMEGCCAFCGKTLDAVGVQVRFGYDMMVTRDDGTRWTYGDQKLYTACSSGCVDKTIGQSIRLSKQELDTILHALLSTGRTESYDQIVTKIRALRDRS